MKIRGLQGTKYVDGGLCAPKEFRMASNKDLAILYCEWECVSAYIATENIFKSECVKLCLRRPQHFKSHAVVLSNLSSDAMGWDDAKIVYDRMQTIAKGLQMDYRRAYAVSLADLKTAPRGFDEEEIYAMTKDLRWRVADNAMNLTGVEQYTLALQFFIGNDYPCVMAGTMFWGAEGDNRKRIIVLTTDVLIQEELMRRALEKEYRESVMLLGGEQGVNDCACILSNGRVKNMKIEVADSEYSKFVRALRHVMTELCRRAACGGDESKLITYQIRGAESSTTARGMAKRLADRFWKRGIVFSDLATDVLYAIGGVEAEVPLENISIWVTSSNGKILVFDEGRFMPYAIERVHDVFAGEGRCLKVELNCGNFHAQSFGAFAYERD